MEIVKYKLNEKDEKQRRMMIEKSVKCFLHFDCTIRFWIERRNADFIDNRNQFTGGRLEICRRINKNLFQIDITDDVS